MRPFVVALRGLAVALALLSALHLLLGLGADQLMGVELPDATVSNPGLASQNRFFGVSYFLYAVVLWLASSDLGRYRPVLVAALYVTIAGGLSRLIAWFAFGAPPLQVMLLMATEILIPPVMLAWLSRLDGHVEPSLP